MGRDRPGAFGKIHTKNMAELTSFSICLNYLDQDKYDEAREAFQKALDEDSKFDLAQQTLMFTPVSAMARMGIPETASELSSSDVSAAAAGSSVAGSGVGIVGVTTGIVLGAAAIAGVAAAAGSEDGTVRYSVSTNFKKNSRDATITVAVRSHSVPVW